MTEVSITLRHLRTALVHAGELALGIPLIIAALAFQGAVLPPRAQERLEVNRISARRDIAAVLFNPPWETR